MLSENKMFTLYEEVIDATPLTAEVLAEIGFNQMDLMELIKKGILVQEGSTFRFKDVLALYDYRYLLREQGLGTRSKICYSRCSELDENHVYYLIKEQVELKNYNVAVAFVIDKLSEGCKFDAGIIAFMINYIGNLSIENQRQVSKTPFSVEDPVLDQIILDLFQYKFSKAKKEICPVLLNGDFRRKNLIVGLLNACIKRSEIFKQRLANYTADCQWQELFNLLKKEKKCRGLNKANTYILMLLEDLLSADIPEKINGEAKNIYEAIELYDYDRALQLLEDIKVKKISSTLVEIFENLLTALIEKRDKKSIGVEEDKGIVANISDVLEDIIMAGMSLLEVGEKYQLSVEQMCLVKLILAKGFYKICYDDVANALVEMVKKCNVVSEVVQKAMDEAMIAHSIGMNLNDKLSVALKRVDVSKLLKR